MLEQLLSEVAGSGVARGQMFIDGAWTIGAYLRKKTMYVNWS